MSFILEEDNLLEIQNDCEREKLDNIQCNFIYINPNSYIDKISIEIIDLEYNKDKDMMYIPKSEILKIIQEQKSGFKDKKYIYKNACSYIIDLEPDDIKPFIDGDVNDSSYNFLKTLPLLEDIYIPESIFIFHKLNCIYFLFQESEKQAIIPKPILKILPNNNEKARESSKKVTIKLNNVKNNITKKQKY